MRVIVRLYIVCGTDRRKSFLVGIIILALILLLFSNLKLSIYVTKQTCNFFCLVDHRFLSDFFLSL